MHEILIKYHAKSSSYNLNINHIGREVQEKPYMAAMMLKHRSKTALTI